MARVKHRKRRRHQTEDARLAEMLLPPTPEGCPSYTRFYYESYRGQLFQACSNSHHRHCPRTSDQHHVHLYCKCPCHRTDLTKHAKRKLWLALKADMEKQKAKITKRIARIASPPGTKAVRPRTSRGASTRFRFVKPLERIPAGIMAVVHQSIATLKDGTVLSVADFALTKGLKDFTSQDYVTQTSIMLHRMLHAGVVEVVK